MSLTEQQKKWIAELMAAGYDEAYIRGLLSLLDQEFVSFLLEISTGRLYSW